MLDSKTGTSFRQYKTQTIQQKILKSMIITKRETVEKHPNILEKSINEQNPLFNDILNLQHAFFFSNSHFFTVWSKLFSLPL